MTHNKALVISRWWAGIFASLAVASGVSAFGFAWNANSQQAVMQDKIEKIEESKLPERMARIEETVKSTDKTVDDIKLMQRDMGQKIDLLVQRQSERQR